MQYLVNRANIFMNRVFVIILIFYSVVNYAIFNIYENTRGVLRNVQYSEILYLVDQYRDD